VEDAIQRQEVENAKAIDEVEKQMKKEVENPSTDADAPTPST
jgi:antitoxin component HigA of HigAB toxin-antitoxin module